MMKLMTKFSKIFIFGVVTIAFSAVQFSIQPNIAFACSCPGMPYAPEQSFSVAKAVFSGRVLHTTINEGPDPPGAIFPHRRVGIQVLESWKGIDSRIINLATGVGEGGGDCGFNFKEGEEYLIYAYEDTQYQADLGTGICQRTKLLAQAQEELEFLGSDTIPLAQEPDYPVTISTDAIIGTNQDDSAVESNNSNIRVITFGIGALAVVLFLLIRFFMKRKND